MPQLLRPLPLVKGDQIAIVATARKISREEMLPAIKLLREWGLVPVEAENLYAVDDQFAGSDALRANDLNAAIQNKNIKAILLARGGYGNVRIIDQLDTDALITNRKWIVGFSDATILLNHISMHPGIESIHGDMAITLPRGTNESIAALKELLFGGDVEIEIPEHPFNQGLDTEGQLIGGNLSVLYSMLGSRSLPDPKGKILFLEDLDEYLYHIDRMMIGLKRAGFLNGLSAILVGGLTDMKDNSVPFGSNAEQIIRNHALGLVETQLFGVPAGHIQNNSPLVIGRNYQIKKIASGFKLIPKRD